MKPEVEKFLRDSKITQAELNSLTEQEKLLLEKITIQRLINRDDLTISDFKFLGVEALLIVEEEIIKTINDLDALDKFLQENNIPQAELAALQRLSVTVFGALAEDKGLQNLIAKGKIKISELIDADKKLHLLTNPRFQKLILEDKVDARLCDFKDSRPAVASSSHMYYHSTTSTATAELAPAPSVKAVILNK